MSSFKADHWSKLTAEEVLEWASLAPNFTPKELASKGDGSLLIVKEALKALQSMRDSYDAPLTINSAYRDLAYNKLIGGVNNSQHTLGTAFDIHLVDKKVGPKFESMAKESGFVAIGRYNTFIHVDFRSPKKNGGGYRWGSW